MGMDMGPRAMRDMVTTKRSNMLLGEAGEGGRDWDWVKRPFLFFQSGMLRIQGCRVIHSDRACNIRQ